AQLRPVPEPAADGVRPRSNADEDGCGRQRGYSELRPVRSTCLLILFIVLVVIDHDVVKTLDIFEKSLKSLIPFRGGFVKKSHALVYKAKLDVADHYRV